MFVCFWVCSGKLLRTTVPLFCFEHGNGSSIRASETTNNVEMVMSNTAEVRSITKLPKVVDVRDQPCQRLYEQNPVLLGYDVVEYHFIPSFREGGKAKQGIAEYAYNFNGYQFWFHNEANRQLFIEDPWKYAPAWGGFCSYGVGFELPPRWPWEKDFLGPPASPWEGWFIQDGVLAFNIWSSFTTKFFEQDQPMENAAQQWTRMHGKLQAGPFNTHCIGHGPLQNWCLSQQPSPWLKPLPSCDVQTSNETCRVQVLSTTDQVVDENCLGQIQMLNSGGIVGTHDDFDDFSNHTTSPWMRTFLIILGCVVGFCFLGCIPLTYYRERRRSRKEGANGDSTPNKDDEKERESQEERRSASTAGTTSDEIPS